MRLHVGYCTAARNRWAKQVANTEIVALPVSRQIGPAYGLAVLRDTRPRR